MCTEVTCRSLPVGHFLREGFRAVCRFLCLAWAKSEPATLRTVLLLLVLSNLLALVASLFDVAIWTILLSVEVTAGSPLRPS